jgi:hypothetical protein
MEFTADGNLTAVSGEMRSVTKVSIQKHDEGFAVYVEKFIEHNGKPNCQGIPAESVRAWLVQASYYECDGSVLRSYFGPKGREEFLELVRPAPGSA